MKTILIMTDSLRRDFIGAYGNNWIKTPNIDSLAKVSHVFDQCYAGSFPTVPNRRDIHIGIGFGGSKFNPWVNVSKDDLTMADRLSKNNIHTMMIVDSPNSFSYGQFLNKGFFAYSFIRGQESDLEFSDATIPINRPIPSEMMRYKDVIWEKIITNRYGRKFEEDWFAPKTFKRACEWLEVNYMREDFFLWVETFDPHEPWDPPIWYEHLYDPDYDGPQRDSTVYGKVEKLGISPREMKNIRAKYSGKITMVDNAIGRLIHTIKKLGIWDDTLIILTSDHGQQMDLEGDCGLVGKICSTSIETGAANAHGKRNKGPWEVIPMRTGILRIPLIIRLPGQNEEKRINTITQPWDLQPTILDFYNIEPDNTLQGISLFPIMKKDDPALRKFAFSWCGQQRMNVMQAINKDWIYAYYDDPKLVPWLIDLNKNTPQDKNVLNQYPEIAKEMHNAMIDFDPSFKWLNTANSEIP